jgi:AcrR family transcriptional regulator
VAASKDRAGRAKAKLEGAILDAAETLFGRHGPDGVSFRQVAAAAGTANNFAVQYHFKDKGTLVRAIYERRLPSLEARRGVLLNEVVRQKRQGDVRALVHVLHRPIVDEIDVEGRRSYAAFLLGMRLFGELEASWAQVTGSAPLTLHVVDLIRVALNTPPEPLLLERLNAAAALFLTAVVDWDRRAGMDLGAPDPDFGPLSRTLDFCAAGLTMPFE